MAGRFHILFIIILIVAAERERLLSPRIPWRENARKGHRKLVHAPSQSRNRQDVRSVLRGAGLRPTRQRVALGELLFAEGDWHMTAEMLHERAIRRSIPVSLATVYNTLHQFTEAGLLNEVVVDGSKTYFDTNVSNHHHFFIENDNAIMDIPGGGVAINRLPAPPEGMEIARVDVVVRLRRIAGA